jgi:hypothetical protein
MDRCNHGPATCCSDHGPPTGCRIHGPSMGRIMNGPSTGRIIVRPHMGHTIREPITVRKMGRKWARVEIVCLWPDHNGPLIGRI